MISRNFFAQFVSKNGDGRWLVSTPKSHHYARRFWLEKEPKADRSKQA